MRIEALGLQFLSCGDGFALGTRSAMEHAILGGVMRRGVAS